MSIEGNEDDEAFLRSLIRPEEDRRLLHPELPWLGGYRWFRSANVIPMERYRERRATPLRANLEFSEIGEAMGGQSSFERREDDFCPTPLAAVKPLVPDLRAAGINLRRTVPRRRQPGQYLKPSLRAVSSPATSR